MSAKSSIHIEQGHAGFLQHNSREKPTKNSVFFDEKNEYSCSAKQAFEIYRTELQKRTEAYTKNTKRSLHKKTITHLSAIVNLNSTHTLRDLQPLINYLENTLDTKVFQVAIHRDEGHMSDDGNKIKNYHAHLEFLGLDSKGKSIRRKLTKSYLINLQTKTAELLKMQRGKNYTQERAKRPKRLDTYDFKAAKQAEAKAVKLTVTNLKKEIQSLRSKLIKTNKDLEEKGKDKIYTADDYQALNALKRELNKQNLQEIYEEYINLKNRLEVFRTGIFSVKDFAEKEYNLPVKNQEDLDNFLNHLKQEKAKLKEDADESFFNKFFKLKELKRENEQLKTELEQLKNRPAAAPKPEIIYKEKIVYQEDTDKIEDLKQENEELKLKNKKLEEELEAERKARAEAEARVKELTDQANQLLTQLESLKKALKEAKKANQNKKKKRGIAP